MEKTKAIRRTEAALIVLFLLALILPQVIGSEGTAGLGSPGDIASVSDLQDKRFAVVAGSSYDILFPSLFPNGKVTYVTDWAEECMQVAQGKADAVLWEASSLNELAEEYPSLMPLPEVVTQLEFRWCTQKTKMETILGRRSALSSSKCAGRICWKKSTIAKKTRKPRRTMWRNSP